MGEDTVAGIIEEWKRKPDRELWGPEGSFYNGYSDSVTGRKEHMKAYTEMLREIGQRLASGEISLHQIGPYRRGELTVIGMDMLEDASTESNLQNGTAQGYIDNGLAILGALGQLERGCIGVTRQMRLCIDHFGHVYPIELERTYTIGGEPVIDYFIRRLRKNMSPQLDLFDQPAFG